MGKKLRKITIRKFLRKNKFSYKRIRKIPSLKKEDAAFEFFKQETERHRGGNLKIFLCNLFLPTVPNSTVLKYYGNQLNTTGLV